MATAGRKAAHTRKAPKKITESYLHNAGLHYLQRFSTGTENFRRVMMRKVDRSCRHHKDQNREECAAMVETLIEKFARSGLLNDADYTRAAVATLRRRGESARAIAARLRAKGLPPEEIRKNLQVDDGEDAGFQAALRFARRRRLGPFSTGKPKEHEKQMAAFARAGHEYEVAAKVLKLNPDEAAELL
jgi:regulatory protein